MIVNVQTMSGAKYALEVNATDSIAALKQQLHTTHNVAEVEDQKLIYAGKILRDEQSVGDGNIKDQSVIILMISAKRKAKPATADTSMATASTANDTTTAASSSNASSATTAASTTATPVAATTAPITSAPAATATAPAATTASISVPSEDDITSLMSLGFQREAVLRALRAAFNNVERAADYLYTGIPASAVGLAEGARAGTANASANNAAPAAATAGATARAGAGAATTAGGGAAAGVTIPGLGELGDVRALRQVIQSNPQVLQLLIGQLAQSNPQLIQQLQDNPQMLQQVLTQLGLEDAGGAGGDEEDDGGDDDGGDGRGRGHAIHVTEAESAQIETLSGLGYSRDICIEAWLICDRNTELAAAFLLEHGANMTREMEQAEAEMAQGGGGNNGGRGGGGGGFGDMDMGDDDDDDHINPDDYIE